MFEIPLPSRYERVRGIGGSFPRLDLKPPCWRFRSGIGKAAQPRCPLAAVAFLMRRVSQMSREDTNDCR
jgi:hypothetical protein